MKITSEKLIRIIREEVENQISPNCLVDVSVSPSLERCNDNLHIIEDFCNFCAQFLKIDHPIKILISDNRDDSGIRTTASYDPQNHKISIYGKARAVVDICRSIAHEMTHMSQMLEDRIEFPVQDIGGEIEDEANAKAGEIIKAYAQSEDYRNSIYESRIFRNGIL